MSRPAEHYVPLPLPANRRYTLSLHEPDEDTAPPWLPPSIVLLGVAADGHRTAIAGAVIDLAPLPLDDADPARALRWNRDTMTLSVSQALGERRVGLWLKFRKDGSGARGVVCCDGRSWGIGAVLDTVRFSCAIATDAGVSIEDDKDDLGLSWDPASSAWSGAGWTPDALRFSYGVKERSIGGQELYTLFAGFATPGASAPWMPGGPFTHVQMSNTCQLTFSSITAPATGDKAIPTMPYLFIARMNGSGDGFVGAALVGQRSAAGTPLALSGRADNSAIVGPYRAGAQGLFLVDGGKLLVGGSTITDAKVHGDTLSWSGLTPQQAAASGLPASGSCRFDPSGAGADTLQIRRADLREDSDAQQAFAAWPCLAGRIVAGRAAAQDQPLPPTALETLLNITPYGTDANGGWLDTVQTFVQADVNQLLLNNIPDKLYGKFYGGQPKPALPAYLASIAQLPGTRGGSPSTFYGSAAIAFLTMNLAQGSSDKYAKKLNAMRAQKWLRQNMAASDVWAAQAPASYAWHFNATLDISQYLDDQATFATRYAGRVAKDLVVWKASMAKRIQDPEVLKRQYKKMEALALLGSNGCYWAYELFRAATTSSFMDDLASSVIGAEALSGGVPYMVSAQSIMALLNQLDSSGAFHKAYHEILQAHFASTILPNLLDPGNAERDSLCDLVYAMVQQLFSTSEADAPEIAAIKAALAALPATVPPAGAAPDDAAAAAAMPTEETIRAWCDAILNISTAISGSYSWEKLANRIDEDFDSFKYKAALRGIRGVTALIMVANLYSFVQGVRDWKEETPAARAGVVLGGTALFIQIAGAAIKRSLAFAYYFEDGGLKWAVSNMLDVNSLANAGKRASNALARWLLDKCPAAELGPRMQAELGLLHMPGTAAGTVQTAVEDSRVYRFFGRTLDEFMATRVAATLAVLSIAYSAYLIYEDSDPTEQAINGLMLSSSILAFAGALMEWFAADACAAAIPAVNVLAAAVAVAGFILLLVESLQPPPDPVQEFGENQANAMGLWMPKGFAIDYFQAYQPSGATTLIGISLSSDTSYLQMLGRSSGANGQVTVTGSAALGALDYSFGTVFFLDVDAQGRATISTLYASSAGQVSLVLAVDAAGTLTVCPAGSCAATSQQHWRVHAYGGADWNGANLASANFQLQNVFCQEQGLPAWLAVQAGAPALQNHSAVDASNWTIAMQPRAPGGVRYAAVSFHADLENASWLPTVVQQGSAPVTWAISPALPAFMQLDTSSGALQQVPGQAASATPAASYTVTATNSVGQASATLALTITA